MDNSLYRLQAAIKGIHTLNLGPKLDDTYLFLPCMQIADAEAVSTYRTDLAVVEVKSAPVF